MCYFQMKKVDTQELVFSLLFILSDSNFMMCPKGIAWQLQIQNLVLSPRQRMPEPMVYSYYGVKGLVKPLIAKVVLGVSPSFSQL